jgi:hypothetical protein
MSDVISRCPKAFSEEKCRKAVVPCGLRCAEKLRSVDKECSAITGSEYARRDVGNSFAFSKYRREYKLLLSNPAAAIDLANVF